MDKLTVPHIVSHITYSQVMGDLMEVYTDEIGPEEIRFDGNYLFLDSLCLKVENGRYAFAQALSCFKEPKMQYWAGYNSVCENTVFDGEITMGSFNAIGGSGFGYERVTERMIGSPHEESFIKRIKHLGNVSFGKEVSIGSNTCIDRAVIGSTVIGDYTKIDNKVHIAHGVKIGKRCLIVAGTVIGGSVEIGDDCFLGINSSIKNKVKIGNNVTIGMGAIVLSDVPDGETVKGLYK